ncbi:MAG: restriction endonuclease subunit S [Labilithrix sp.]|nr:restriction endonuclease subunit S [Labilithrix sp.]
MSGRAATVNIIPGDYALSVGRADMPPPPGWRWVALTDEARLESGHTPSREHAEYWNGGIPWIGIRDARAHHGSVILETAQTVAQAGLDNSAARLLRAGTVCLSRTASVGYVVVMGREMATSQDFVNWVCGPGVEPAFLQKLLIAENRALFRFGKGSTHTTIYYPEVKAFHVCLPPLNEQRRIVAKLEALHARSRRAREALDAVPPLLEKLRQSILAAAFRGDLTKDWRAKNKNVEPASKLLERIRAERRKKWEESELAKLKAKGKPPTDDKWKSKYKEPGPIDTSGLPELPAGWCWARAEEVCEFITKGTTPSAEKLGTVGQIPFIKVYNLTFDARVDFTVEPTFVDAQTHVGILARSRVLPGDVLMNIVGPPLGKVGIVPDSFPEWNMNQAIAVFRVVPGLGREYLANHLLSSRTVQWAVQKGKATAGQLNLTLEVCRDLPVPLCPEAEQLLVVNRLSGALSVVRQLGTATVDSLRRIGQLEQAALAKAFRGELVPQDPNDEPAETTSSQQDVSAASTKKPKRRTLEKPTAHA